MRCSILFLGLIIVLGITANAQTREKPVYVYAELGGGAGSIFQLNAELNAIFLEHHQLGIGYARYNKKGNVPSDYHESDFLFPTYPQDILDGLVLSYGYVLYPNNRAKRDVLRYTLRAGVLIGTYSEPGNFHKSGNWLGSNYNYDDLEENGFAVLLQPGVTFTPSKAFGINTGMYGVIGKLSGAGIWGSMLLGKVSDHRRVKRHHLKD